MKAQIGRASLFLSTNSGMLFPLSLLYNYMFDSDIIGKRPLLHP